MGPNAVEDRRITLANLLDERHDEIQRRWLAAAEVSAGHRTDISRTELENAMPDFLAHLSASMRGQEALVESGEAGWRQVAQEHALTRVRLGFDIDELVREFFLLRRVLFDIMVEAGHGCDWTQADASSLTTLIESAVGVSVRSYVDARDYQSRRAEAEHIGFITHELRNPLGVASLGVAMARRLVSPTSRISDAVTMAENGLSRLTTLIDGVLLVERMEAGHIEPALIDVEFRGLLEEALRGARAAAESKRLDLEVQVDISPDAVVHVDPRLAISALQNIFDNAVKYTDIGRIEIRVEDDGDHLTTGVRDNCEGLSPEELRTIFEPFKRGQTRKPGTGLGLAIARRAVEANGGTFQAESSGDRGCFFSVSFPKARH